MVAGVFRMTVEAILPPAPPKRSPPALESPIKLSGPLPDLTSPLGCTMSLLVREWSHVDAPNVSHSCLMIFKIPKINACIHSVTVLLFSSFFYCNIAFACVISIQP